MIYCIFNLYYQLRKIEEFSYTIKPNTNRHTVVLYIDTSVLELWAWLHTHGRVVYQTQSCSGYGPGFAI